MGVPTVGTCRSAGGARGPIAAIVSDVSIPIHRPTVELQRDRMFRFSVLKSETLWRDFVCTSIGILLKHDGAAMRLNAGGNIMRSDEIAIRSLSGIGADGSVMKYVPVLTKPANRSTLGIMSCLHLSKIGINLMCINDEE